MSLMLGVGFCLAGFVAGKGPMIGVALTVAVAFVLAAHLAMFANFSHQH